MGEETKVLSGETPQASPEYQELKSTVDAKLKGGKIELPVLPEAASKVVTLSYDEKCDIGQLATVIKRDQALSANVLRISNTPVYSGGVQIKSLDHAVSRLGMKQVRNIALIISCESRVFQVHGFEKEVRQLFQHSLAAAGFAEEIARIRRLNVEEAFLCGLLHDIGRPVLFQIIADIEQSEKKTYAKENSYKTVDYFHAMLGSEMVKSWSLPERLSETIAFHHHPLQAPTSSQTACVARLASDLAHLLVGPRTFTEEQIRAHAMLTPLNLYEEDVDRLIARKEEIMKLVEIVS